MVVVINIRRTPAGPTSCYLDYSETWHAAPLG